MSNRAKYIKSVSIDKLWGKLTVKWLLRPDVNILSGINGVGKTTILNRVISFLEMHEGEPAPKVSPIEGVHIEFDSPQADYIKYNVIRSYDRPLMLKEVASKVDHNIGSELDWQLYLLQQRYLDYQVNVANRMIECLASDDDETRAQASSLAFAKKRFQDLIDQLFSYTKKTIIRKRNDIAFIQDGRTILPYQLSSGEKQMLLILLTTLVQDNEPYVLFMDEPEASLHIEWQQKLIAIIKELNPNAQLILTTHSPAVIMEGWVDAVTEVSDISCLHE